MNSLKATCTLLLLAEMAGVRVGAIAGVTEEVTVPGVETAEEVGMLGVMVAVVDHPVGGVGGARKDRFLVPINSDFDVYSMGKNLDSVAPLNPPKSQDDVIRASDGGFYGLARNF